MIAVVFPGQGSQKRGMGKELAEAYPAAKAIYDQVSEATGIDVANLSWHEEEEVLRQTENAQIALFTASLAAYEVLKSEGSFTPDAVAGHSVGEFAALVVSGVYTLRDAALLVKARGECMSSAGKETPGTMAAVLGLDSPVLHEICAQVDGLVAVANDNSPGQVVISGEKEAVAQASALTTEAGAKRVIPLNVSGAFHSPLMLSSSKAMRVEFDRYPTSIPTIPIYANVTSEQASANWPELLEKQLVNPVRWTESVQHMVRDGVTTIIECGVGEVLSGLVRRIDKSVTCLKVNDTETLQATLSALNEAP